MKYMRLVGHGYLQVFPSRLLGTESQVAALGLLDLESHEIKNVYICTCTHSIHAHTQQAESGSMFF